MAVVYILREQGQNKKNEKVANPVSKTFKFTFYLGSKVLILSKLALSDI